MFQFFQYKRPSYLEIGLQCMWLDHNDPYLKVGPFKCEEKLKFPEMLIIHNFASKKDAKNVIAESRGKLSVTPLYSGGKSQKGMSFKNWYLACCLQV